MLQIITSSLSIMAPLLLASLGGLYTQIGGTLNIALEGFITISAFSTFVFAKMGFSIFLSIILSILVTLCFSALLSFMVFKLKANVFIAGLASNLLCSGLIRVASESLFNTAGVIQLQNFDFKYNTLFIVLSLILVVVTSLVLKKTIFGFHLCAVGQNQEVPLTVGISTNKIRLLSFLLCGLYCALSGSALTLKLGAYVPNMSASKGWIALVIVFLGKENPYGLLLASLLFGLSEAFSNYLQGALNIPADFILAVPYLLTLCAMIISSMMQRKQRTFISSSK